MSRRTLICVLLLAASLGAIGWQGQRLIARRAIIARHLPPVPAVENWPAEFRDQLAAASRGARSWWPDPRGLAALSRLYHANGFHPEAELCYEGLRALDPRNAHWPYLEAILVADSGRMEDALALHRLAVNLAPAYVPARVRLADLLVKSNRPAEAVPMYAEVLRREPGQPHAQLGLARCALIAGDWTTAREHLREAVALHPDFIGGLSLLVTVSEHFGDRVTATTLDQTIGQRAPSDVPDPWVDALSEACFDAYQLGVTAAIASAAGDNARALDLLDRAIALGPRNGAFRRNAAQILLNDSKPDAARRHLEQAVATDPADSDAWLLLIAALNQLGQEAAARQALARGLAHCPDSAGLHLERARTLVAARRWREAVAEFRISVRLRPTEAAPLVEMADTCFAAGLPEEGLAALHESLSRQPGNPLALSTLTFYYIATGNEAEALRLWPEVRNHARMPAPVLEKLRQAYNGQFKRPLP